MTKDPRWNRSEVRVRLMEQIKTVLATGPLGAQELRDRVDLEGKDEKFLSNTLYGMKAKGLVLFRMADRQWSLASDDTRPLAAGSRVGGSREVPPPPPRTTAQPPSKLTGHRTSSPSVRSAPAALEEPAGGRPEAIERVARLRDQVLAALGRGPQRGMELRAVVDLDGQDDKVLQNLLTRMKRRRTIEYHPEGRIWSLPGDKRPHPSVARSNGAAANGGAKPDHAPASSPRPAEPSPPPPADPPPPDDDDDQELEVERQQLRRVIRLEQSVELLRSTTTYHLACLEASVKSIAGLIRELQKASPGPAVNVDAAGDEFMIRIPTMTFTAEDVDNLGDEAGTALHAALVLIRARNRQVSAR